MNPRPAKFPVRVEKPWGAEMIYIVHPPHYAAKLLLIRAGERLSLQYHQKKAETLLVIGGECDMTLRDKTVRMTLWNFVHIAPRQRHRITAITDTTIVEVSTPELGDVVRLSDDYGRVPLDENSLFK